MTVNRREFLNDAAKTAAADSAAVAAVNASQSLRAADSPNEKIVVGVMGVNGRGTALARGFAAQPGAEVAYVCDVDERAAAKAAGALKGLAAKEPKQIKDFRRMLDDNSLDVLVCAAPDHWHAPATILACSAGKHVYVEKPCSHNPREGELAVAAARKNNRVVQMGNQRRSRPKTIEGIRLVQSGAIGRVYFSRGWYASLRGSIGRGQPTAVPSWLDFDLWQGPAPRQKLQSNLIHYNWHWFWQWGTGEIGNNGVHALDLCRWGLDVDYPTRVTCSGGRYHWQDDQQTPDTHLVSYDFEGGKSIAWEGLSCNRRGPGGSTFGVTFHGENGTIEMDDRRNGYIHYDKSNKVVKEVGGTGGDADHFRNFLDCIRSGERPNSDIEGGHKSTLLCHLGNMAYRTGETVNLDPATHRITDNEKQAALWGREYEKGWEPKV